MKKLHKTSFIGGVGILLWAGALLTLAQTPLTSPAAQKPAELKEQFKKERATQGQELRKSIQTMREELQKKLQADREEAQKRIEAARKAAKEQNKAQREELKKRLEQIRDERKKAAATRLDEQLNRLNERWTTHFTNVLNHLDDVLGKIQIRADKAASLGKDVGAVKTAIGVAKTAIATARTTVEVQAKKTYTATITSDAKLGEAFKSVREQLRKDLFSLRDGAIKNARDAVHDAARALGDVPKVDEEPKKSAAPAPTPAPTPAGTPAPSAR